jgi:hypothetical protein
MEMQVRCQTEDASLKLLIRQSWQVDAENSHSARMTVGEKIVPQETLIW